MRVRPARLTLSRWATRPCRGAGRTRLRAGTARSGTRPPARGSRPRRRAGRSPARRGVRRRGPRDRLRRLHGVALRPRLVDDPAQVPGLVRERDDAADRFQRLPIAAASEQARERAVLPAPDPLEAVAGRGRQARLVRRPAVLVEVDPAGVRGDLDEARPEARTADLDVAQRNRALRRARAGSRSPLGACTARPRRAAAERATGRRHAFDRYRPRPAPPVDSGDASSPQTAPAAAACSRSQRGAAVAPARRRAPAAATQSALSGARARAHSGDRAACGPLRPRAGASACDLDDESERLLPAPARRPRRPARLAAPRAGRAQLPPRARALRRPPARARARPDMGIGKARGVRGLARGSVAAPARLPAEWAAHAAAISTRRRRCGRGATRRPSSRARRTRCRAPWPA